VAGTRIGFIAQEVERVLPDWVGEKRDGTKMLTVRGFEALCVEALRELDGENEALRIENELLHSRVKQLESLASRIEAIEDALAGTFR